MSNDLLMEQIRRVSNKFQKTGGNTFRANCPAHGGKDANLAGKVVNDGSTLITYCHSHGCEYKAVLDAYKALGVQLPRSIPYTPVVAQMRVRAEKTECYRDKKTFPQAMQLWEEAHDDFACFHEHAYAKQKGISHCFGARRRTSKYQDHIVIPLKNWNGDLVGVQTIDQAGCKRIYGTMGHLLLGAYSDPEALIHIVEGWATGFAIATHLHGKVFRNKPPAVLIAFTKHRLGLKAQEARGRFPSADIIEHQEPDNRDFWDICQNLKERDRYVQQLAAGLDLGVIS